MGTKPGYKTTEFWLSLLGTLLGAVMASDILDADSIIVQVIGACLLVLTTMGYTAGRAKVKNAESKVTVNSVPHELVNSLVDRVLEYKQAKTASKNDTDPGRSTGSIN